MKIPDMSDIYNEIYNICQFTNDNLEYRYIPQVNIVSIPKKGDLPECNNYSGISHINVKLKVLLKNVIKRIAKFVFYHG